MDEFEICKEKKNEVTRNEDLQFRFDLISNFKMEIFPKIEKFIKNLQILQITNLYAIKIYE